MNISDYVLVSGKMRLSDYCIKAKVLPKTFLKDTVNKQFRRSKQVIYSFN